MAFVVDPQHPALHCTIALGLAQEALRLGCNTVATEHVLMATMCDPVIRWHVASLGVDLSDMQTLVTRATQTRVSHREHRFVMTHEAADLLLNATAAITDLEPDRRPDPAVRSAAMIAVFSALLRTSDDSTDTSAHRILGELGLLRHTRWLLDALRNSSSAPPVVLPPRLP